MIPAQLPDIKQNLNKAYRLFKPKPAAIKAFKTNLLYLLSRQSQKENEEQVKNYLASILQGTYLEFANEEPQNSSPVCFANVSGLREGFENPFLPELAIPPNLNTALPASTQPPGTATLNPNLKDALHLTKSSVSAILMAKSTNPDADTTALEKRINELVYQLYALTPEEILIVEGR